MPGALTLPALHQELYLLKVLESLNVFVLKVGERLSDSRTLCNVSGIRLTDGRFRLAFVSVVNHQQLVYF